MQTFPGSSVCIAATGGKCTDCENRLTISDNSGICPSCSEGCSLCPSGPETCLACFSGYYKSGTKCLKCTNSNANENPAVTGIPNCVSCIILPGSSFLTCYVKIDGGDDTKKSAFSTGVIAGISVAAVVVVGALIGFLCWWFLCKTKRAGVSSSTTTLTRPTSS